MQRRAKQGQSLKNFFAKKLKDKRTISELRRSKNFRI